jgi:hypothetical protein
MFFWEIYKNVYTLVHTSFIKWRYKIKPWTYTTNFTNTSTRTPTTPHNLVNSRTIKICPGYQHIINPFLPHLKITQPLHQQSILSHPYLHQFLQPHREQSTPRLLYALIITFHPKPNICNILLAQDPTQPWTHTLLDKLHNLPIPHPLQLFHTNKKGIIHPSKNIHDKLYTFIHQHLEPPTTHIIQQHFPYLSKPLITETLHCFEPLTEYTQLLLLDQIPPPPP